MENNTKVRLHLSKQLFESLAKQVLTEAKTKQNLGAGMEEVKAPKEKKEKKAPEVKATDKMKSMEEMETNVAEVSAQLGIPKAPGLNLSKNATQNVVYSKQDLKVKLMDLARQLNMMKGLDNAETTAIATLIDNIISKLKDGTVANQINTANKAFKNATRNVKAVAKEEVNEDLPPGFTGMDPQTAEVAGMIMNLLAAGVGSAVAIAAIKSTNLGNKIKNTLIDLVKKNPKGPDTPKS
jgi:hypothetical protein